MVGVTEYTDNALLDAAPDAMLLIDGDGTITFANDRVRDLFGYEPDEIVGEPVEQLIPEGLREDHVAHREAYRKDPERRPMGVGLTLQALRANGSTVPVDVSLNPLESDDGIKVMATVRDVTEQREHQRQITRLREATRQLIEADTDEEVAQLVATAATDLFGYESCVTRLLDDGQHLRPVAVVGDDSIGIQDLPDYPINENTPVSRVYRSGDPEIYDDVRTLTDGYDRGKARAAMYVPIGDSGVLSILDTDIGVFDQRDLDIALSLTANAETILERVDNERELEHQVNRLDEFAGVLSHDLRNPLNIAQLQVDLAANETDTSHLEKVSDALARMEEIIESTLTLARQGNAVSETEPVTVGDLAMQCWSRTDASNADLQIIDAIHIQADPKRLQHVFENLFHNAVEHGGEDVRLRLGRLTDRAGFYIEDDGPGISESERTHIFEKGYTTSEDGTGFGLAIVQEIVEAHGWDITVTDSSKGGVRFEITGVEFVE
jgi:PAS domain S-box-containing protein